MLYNLRSILSWNFIFVRRTISKDVQQSTSAFVHHTYSLAIASTMSPAKKYIIYYYLTKKTAYVVDHVQTQAGLIIHKSTLYN